MFQRSRIGRETSLPALQASLEECLQKNLPEQPVKVRVEEYDSLGNPRIVRDGDEFVQAFGTYRRVSVDVRFAQPEQPEEDYARMDAITRGVLNGMGIRSRHMDYDPGNFDTTMDADIYMPPAYKS